MDCIQVPDMMCENCVRRMTQALSAAGVTARVSLPDKQVTVEGGEAALRTAVEILEDLGFTPGLSPKG